MSCNNGTVNNYSLEIHVRNHGRSTILNVARCVVWCFSQSIAGCSCKAINLIHYGIKCFSARCIGCAWGFICRNRFLWCENFTSSCLISCNNGTVCNDIFTINIRNCDDLTIFDNTFCIIRSCNQSIRSGASQAINGFNFSIKRFRFSRIVRAWFNIHMNIDLRSKFVASFIFISCNNRTIRNS